MGVTFANLPAAGTGEEEDEVGKKRSAQINLGMLRQGRRRSDRASQGGATEAEGGDVGNPGSSRMSGASESGDGSNVTLPSNPPNLLEYVHGLSAFGWVAGWLDQRFPMGTSNKTSGRIPTCSKP
jgi:hypothetical protein